MNYHENYPIYLTRNTVIFITNTMYIFDKNTQSISETIPDKVIKVSMIIANLVITAIIMGFIYSYNESKMYENSKTISEGELNTMKILFVVFILILSFYILLNNTDEEITQKILSNNNLIIPTLLLVIFFNIYIHIVAKTSKTITSDDSSKSTNDDSTQSTSDDSSKSRQLHITCNRLNQCNNKHDSFNFLNFIIIIFLLLIWLLLYLGSILKSNPDINLKKYMRRISNLLLIISIFTIPAILIASLFDNIETINNTLIPIIKVITGILIFITVCFDVYWIYNIFNQPKNGGRKKNNKQK